MEEILSTTPRGWVSDLQINFELFAQFTAGTYGSADDLLSKFNDHEIISPDKSNNLSLISLSNVDRNIWRWCNECGDEETRDIGVAYWHRHWQRPCVLACLQHSVALREINLPFRERQRRFLLPKDAEYLRHKPACDDDQLKLALSIAQIDQKLSNERAKFNPDVLRATLDKDRRAYQESSSYNQITRLLTRGNSRENSYIQKLLKADRIALHYLPAFINLMYGSFEHFLGQYRWTEVMYHEPDRIPQNTFKDTRSIHREVCVKFLAINPSAARTDFWKVHPKSARWLSKYDVNWFITYFPINNGPIPHQWPLI